MKTEWQGYYLDGKTASRQPTMIRLMKTGLEIITESRATLWWPYHEIRQTQGFYAGEQVRLERGKEISEVIVVSDTAFLTDLHRLVPELGTRFHNPARRGMRFRFTVFAAMAAVTGDASEAMAYGLETARTLGMLRYSRQKEEEADAEGMRMLLAAGINPEGMIAFFEMLKKEEGQTPEFMSYLSTHPTTQDRIEKLKSLASQPQQKFSKLYPDYEWKDLQNICKENAD
jgi:hypothetical protein